jgi:hypothetical protein
MDPKGGVLPAKNVLAVGDNLKMIGIDAARDAALVVNVQFLRRASTKKFQREPMGKNGPTTSIVFAADTDNAIAMAINGSFPKPAAAIGFWAYLGHKAVNHRQRPRPDSALRAGRIYFDRSRNH